MKNPPFTINSKILNLVVETCEKLTLFSVTKNNPLVPHLRKENRLKTIRASLAIESNSLNLEQVTAIVNGKRVLGKPKEIKEVQNAYEAYEFIIDFNGLDVKDLLKAHHLMMKDLIHDSGSFRKENVGIFDGHKKLVHLAPPPEFVENQIKNLFEWYKNSEVHPLIKSSVFHYEFEFIHPFSDGNGRMGRMWQSKLLGEWNNVFYFLPVEELIIKKQKEYYDVLAKSNKNGECTLFLEYIIDIINENVKELVKDTIQEKDISKEHKPHKRRR